MKGYEARHDLARELLLTFEAEPLDGNFWRVEPDALGITGHSPDEIAYHLTLLIETAHRQDALTCNVAATLRQCTRARAREGMCDSLTADVLSRKAAA